jgi:hypothetical protein
VVVEKRGWAPRRFETACRKDTLVKLRAALARP